MKGCCSAGGKNGRANQRRGQVPHLSPCGLWGLHRRALQPEGGSMTPTQRKPLSVWPRWRRMSVCGWKHSVWLPRPLLLHLPHRWRRMRACSHQTPPENLPSHRFPWRFSELILCQLVQLHVSSWKHGVWLARTCLLHGFLLLPHKVRSAVGLRGSGAEIPDACVSTAADDQLLQVSRPAAERAARQAASRQASPEHMAPAATQRGSEPTSSRRLRWSRRRGMRQKDMPCCCCRLWPSRLSTYGRLSHGRRPQ